MVIHNWETRGTFTNFMERRYGETFSCVDWYYNDDRNYCISKEDIVRNDRMTTTHIPPCFLPGTLVEVPSNDTDTRTFEDIYKLNEGDAIVTEDGRYVYVKHIVNFNLPTSIMCPLDDDLLVTLTQPVRRIQERLSRIRKPWSVAKDLHTIGRIPRGIDGRNLILSDGGSMIRTHRWECVTLGHGIADNDVTADNYWGTQSVVQDFLYYQNGGGKGDV
jgi:hypothetical protein